MAHSICRCEPEDEDCEEVCVEYDKYILNVTDYIATLQLLQHRNIPIHFIIGPGSVKMDLKGINVKTEVFKQNERLMNISRKFEGGIFINNEAMSVRTCVYNAFLHRTSLMSIITF